MTSESQVFPQLQIEMKRIIIESVIGYFVWRILNLVVDFITSVATSRVEFQFVPSLTLGSLVSFVFAAAVIWIVNGLAKSEVDRAKGMALKHVRSQAGVNQFPWIEEVVKENGPNSWRITVGFLTKIGDKKLSTTLQVNTITGEIKSISR